MSAEVTIIDGGGLVLCGCVACFAERCKSYKWQQMPGFRPACEKCGNRNCPHHSDHTLTCTRSNDRGQPGSLFT